MRRRRTGLVALFAAALLACSQRDDPSPTCDVLEYASCTDECSGDARCMQVAWRDGVGRLCTRECESGFDCISTAAPGRCLDVNRSGTFLCYKSCDPGPCPDGQVCQPLHDGTAVCLP